jgi:hypothetical protein
MLSQIVYDHAARTCAAIGSFIKYLPAYEQVQRKKGNPELLNSEPVNAYFYFYEE